ATPRPFRRTACDHSSTTSPGHHVSTRSKPAARAAAGRWSGGSSVKSIERCADHRITGSRAVAAEGRREELVRGEAAEPEPRHVRELDRTAEDLSRHELPDRRAELEAVSAPARREVEPVDPVDAAQDRVPVGRDRVEAD